MEKKNPYKFTLGFDKTKPTHVCAAEILNSVRDKADLIASAVVAHIDGGSTEKGAVLNQEALQIMMLELVKQEVEKAMQNYFSKQENVQVEEETEEDVIEKQKISEFVLAPEVAKSVRDAMSAFRNIEKKKEASDFECFFFVAHLCQFTGTPQISHRFLTDFIRIIKSQILSEKGLIEWILFFQCRKKPTHGA